MLDFLFKEEKGCKLHSIIKDGIVDIVIKELKNYSGKSVGVYHQNNHKYLGVKIFPTKCKKCRDYIEYGFGHYCCNVNVIGAFLKNEAK